MTALEKRWYVSGMSAAPDRREALDARQTARVGDDSRDRGGRCGQRAREERPAALALAALEVAVRGADGVLTRRKLVAVHGDAHRAAGFPPIGAGGSEDLVESLALRLALHLVGAGHDHHADAFRNLPAVQRSGGKSQVADPPVGARPDEHDIDLLPQQR